MARTRLKPPQCALNPDRKEISLGEMEGYDGGLKTEKSIDVIFSFFSDLSRVRGDVPSLPTSDFSRCAKPALQTSQNVIITGGTVG